MYRFTCLAALTAVLSFAETLTDQQMEQFLRTATVSAIKSVNVGIAQTRRADLTDGKISHRAHIQIIDEAKARFEGTMGSEINFRDTWKFNVAAYKLDRLLDINLTPVSVERTHGGSTGSFTWWIDDAMMEVDRKKKGLQPPDQDSWNQQMFIVRVFDQLIYNTDRNLQNLIIDKEWRIWMIDHTRAFRLMRDVREPKNLTKCDKGLLDRLRRLKRDEVEEATKPYLTKMEVDGIVARAQKIVALFDKGGSAVLYDRAKL